MAGVELKIVTQDEAGMRLDRWFKVHFPGLGFGPLQKLLRSGQVDAVVTHHRRPQRRLSPDRGGDGHR